MDEERSQALEREYARKKLQEWSAVDEIVYSRHISLEQCSSEQTAKYKSTIIGQNKDTFVDLTGGFGVDCYYIGRHFKKAVYVEQNPELCNKVQHNFKVLSYNQCQVLCDDAENYLRKMEKVHLIYIDPARRDGNGRRTYAIEDCTPNIQKLNDLLLEKSDRVIIKLSPLFDWHKAVKDVKGVVEVHIVSVGNECKELLLILEKDAKPLKLVCINDDETYKRFVVENSTNGDYQTCTKTIDNCCYLYEPNASIMKAGCFGWITEDFNVMEVSANSHIFLSEEAIKNFPGRKFVIKQVSTLNKKESKLKLSGIGKANITTRNFPIKPQELRKRLHLKDGGENYIFATTTKENKHILFVCNKIFL